jgi:DNA-binding MarR family transcriptional regulator
MYYQIMTNYKKDLINILEMLSNIEKDLNLINYNETEKKVYYTIACKISSTGKCNISDVINDSGFSRSTVYKTIKKFESADLVYLTQSNVDKREFNLALAAEI